METLPDPNTSPISLRHRLVAPTVVVIEDDEYALYSLTRLLRHSGCHVLPEARAEGGLTTIFSSTPDLVLLDLGLPGLMGEDILEALSQNDPFIPVLLVTGSTKARAVAAEWPNVVGFFQKPYDSGLLVAMVEDLLALA